MNIKYMYTRLYLNTMQLRIITRSLTAARNRLWVVAPAM